MSVTISRAARKRILAEAAQSPNEEVCGLLFGGESRIVSVLPTINIADNPANSFEIDPAALFAAIRNQRGGGERIVGHYHSHPEGPARPSVRDTEMALDTGRLWLIVTAGEMSLWRAGAPGQLEPVELALASPPSNRQ
ncbi:proteasome lid subunit RPN8/RPN11 [Parasphingopyxis lamellibrachiae]|uniref:Proteasome lid subunit RPN8/RPN11 n=1 Tax=Parasphingopyxis lamellibrachiae TaxID=680125 RepID=A0A3D9FCC2_9SPHN|nr:proteasome lid subunit RPN8/RPN11 [Parasphingopyxis lamellibrachiae]